MEKLSHVDAQGQAQMVDVTPKLATTREATAEGLITMHPDAYAAVVGGNAPKGDVLGTARIAAIMAAKKTSDLIPLCHPLPIGSVKVEITPEPTLPGFRLAATVKLTGTTGVEMEALTAVSVGLLTLYDMSKALDKSMVIREVRLLSKKGGKSGDWSPQPSVSPPLA
jgi:cyclic pyranopterin monophosphate synthase